KIDRKLGSRDDERVSRGCELAGERHLLPTNLSHFCLQRRELRVHAVELRVDRVEIEQRRMCTRAQRAQLSAQRRTRPGRVRDRHAEHDEDAENACKTRRRGGTGPAHEGGTLPRSRVWPDNFVRSDTGRFREVSATENQQLCAPYLVATVRDPC